MEAEIEERRRESTARQTNAAPNDRRLSGSARRPPCLRVALALALTLALVAATPYAFAYAGTIPTVESGSGSVNARVVGSFFASGLMLKPANVRSFRWGLTAPATPGTGRPTFAALSVVKAIDVETPGIMVHAAASRHFDTATLDVYASGTTTVLARYQFTDVTVSSVTHADPGRPTGGEPLEELTITYHRIQITVGASTTCWDLASNARC
jgi:type VI protein secretion system component Hcp